MRPGFFRNMRALNCLNTLGFIALAWDKVGTFFVEDVADMMGETRTSQAVEVECSVDSHRLQLPHFVIKLGDCGNDVSRIKPKCFRHPT